MRISKYGILSQVDDNLHISKKIKGLLASPTVIEVLLRDDVDTKTSPPGQRHRLIRR
jgi:hypothetical protein